MEVKARNVMLTEDLWKRVKVAVAQKGLTMKDGVRVAIEAFVMKAEQENREREMLEAEHAQMERMQAERAV